LRSVAGFFFDIYTILPFVPLYAATRMSCG